ncbi:hypothetical protein FEV13_00670 (plasmid) [Stutzerimonas degradans]|nr:hypothetical protein FEV13_00670 [Stutzerimonas degradans]
MEHALTVETESYPDDAWSTDPSAPLGMKLGQTSMKLAVEDFIVTGEHGNSFTNGPVLEVISAEGRFPEIQQILLAFDENQILDAAWLTMEAKRYEEMVALLSESMHAINTHEPIKGSRNVLFHYAGGQVEIHAPLFSQEMTIGYSSGKFHQAKMSKSSSIYE